MAEQPIMNFDRSSTGLFSPEEIHRLMRVEYGRSGRYRYPILLMLIEIDRLETLHDLYGSESRDRLIASVVELLSTVTRGSDFLGCMVDKRLMVVFPHTPREAAVPLTERLLEGVRGLAFEGDGRTLRTSLSIGAIWSGGGDAGEGEDRGDFQTFAASAEEALNRAVTAGGDRAVVSSTDQT